MKYSKEEKRIILSWFYNPLNFLKITQYVIEYNPVNLPHVVSMIQNKRYSYELLKLADEIHEYRIMGEMSGVLKP